MHGKQVECGIESNSREAGLPVRSVDGMRANTSVNGWSKAIGLLATFKFTPPIPE
jgi:hypothetical protein